MVQTGSGRFVRDRAQIALETQHVRLLALGHSILKLDDPERVRARLFDLFALAIAHFRDEEEFLRTLDYPRFQEHVECHRELLDVLSGIVVNFRDEVIDLPRLKRFLFDWARSHLVEHDVVFLTPLGGGRAKAPGERHAG